MKISVNICLYNSTRYIKETLDSVFAQTYQDYEVVAIDDGSTDGTYEFIKERYNEPRLKLYRQVNHGLSYTRNRCAEPVGGYHDFCVKGHLSASGEMPFTQKSAHPLPLGNIWPSWSMMTFGFRTN